MITPGAVRRSFLDLPFEIRRLVLDHALRLQRVIPAGSRKNKRLQLDRGLHTFLMNFFLVSRQFSEEAADAFFSTNIFDVVPVRVAEQRADHSTSITALSDRRRARMTAVQLLFGAPWDHYLEIENLRRYGTLRTAVHVRCLHVFTSARADWISGVQRDRCVELLELCLDHLPNLTEVRFESRTHCAAALASLTLAGVTNSSLIDELVDRARSAGKYVTWGVKMLKLHHSILHTALPK